MHDCKSRLGCDAGEGVGRSQSVIVVRDDLGVLEIFANQFESKAETAHKICGLAQKWQIGDWMGGIGWGHPLSGIKDWMGPPTLRYQGIGWGHPLSGTKEMWMAPFVFFIGRQSAEVNVLGTVKVGDAIGQFKGTSAENDQVPCGVK